MSNGFEGELQRACDGQTGALTALDPAPGSTLAPRFRHHAPIVTQLMAARLDAPQTRARRRIGDAEGVAAYGATGEKIRLGQRKSGPSWAA